MNSAYIISSIFIVVIAGVILLCITSDSISDYLDNHGRVIRKFKELVKSSDYISSNYQIQKVNNNYRLFDKLESKYVDLSDNHRWDETSKFYQKYCVGSLREVIDVYYLNNPKLIKY